MTFIYAKFLFPVIDIR